MKSWIALLLLAATAETCLAARREVHVAAASNLTEVFREVGVQFEAATGIHPVFSYGSTAQLARQVENGAPFDVIAVADMEHVDGLEKKGLLAPGSRAVYAIGVLALWVPPGGHGRIEALTDLAGAGVKVIAIANPGLAPYGKAAVDTLRRAGLWEKVQSRIVFGENISVVKQYGASGNADAVFTALSLVRNAPGKVIPIAAAQHAPLAQALGIIKSAQDAAAAKAFVDFLLRGAGHGILMSAGYGPAR